MDVLKVIIALCQIQGSSSTAWTVQKNQHECQQYYSKCFSQKWEICRKTQDFCNAEDDLMKCTQDRKIQ